MIISAFRVVSRSEWREPAYSILQSYMTLRRGVILAMAQEREVTEEAGSKFNEDLLESWGIVTCL